MTWNNITEQAVGKAMQSKHAALLCEEFVLPNKDVSDAIYHIPSDTLIIRSFIKNAELDDIKKNIVDNGLRAITITGNNARLNIQNKQGDFVVVYRPVSPIQKTSQLLKCAEIDFLRDLGSITGWNDDLVDVPGYPSPVAATLGSGLLGAGLGYTASIPGSKVLPKKWNKKKFKRLMTILPALVGASVGLPWLIGAIGSGQNPFSEDVIINRDHQRNKFGMYINVPDFKKTLYNDPMVSDRLTDRTRAMADGFVSSASVLKDSLIVTPVDMGRLALGMGSGYVSGALVGKALCLLAGAPPAVEDKLKQTGIYAGVINAIMPQLFKR